MKRPRRSLRSCGCMIVLVLFICAGVSALISPRSAGVTGPTPPSAFEALAVDPAETGAPAQPTATITEISAPTNTPVPMQPSATITDTPLPPPPTTLPTRVVTLYVAKSQPINVRASASASAAALGQLPPGAPVPVLAAVDGQTYNGSAHWYQIDYNGQIGYVHGSLLADHPVTIQPTAAPVQRQVVPTSAPQPLNPPVNVPPSNSFVCPKNCAGAVQMGLSPEQAASCPGLDRDHDGVACYGS